MNIPVEQLFALSISDPSIQSRQSPLPNPADGIETETGAATIRMTNYFTQTRTVGLEFEIPVLPYYTSYLVSGAPPPPPNQGNSSAVIQILTVEESLQAVPWACAVDYVVGVAQQDYNRGNFAGAETRCLQLLAEGVQSAKVFHLLSTIQCHWGLWDRAIQYSCQAVQLEPALVDAYIVMGVAFKGKKMWQDAVRCFRHATVLQPEGVHGFIGLATTAIYLGDTALVISAYTKALSLHPDASVWTDFGNYYKSIGRLEDAEHCYTKAVEVDERFIFAWCNLGKIFDSRGDVWLSINAFTKVVSYSPNYLEGYIYLGNVFVKNGIYERAAELFAKAFERFPSYPDFYKGFAEANFHLKKWDICIEMGFAALQLLPQYPYCAAVYADTLCLIGNAYRSKGEIAQASTQYMSALGHVPNHVQAFLAFGIIRVDEKMWKKAEEIFRTVILISPNCTDAIAGLSKVLMETGRFDEAGSVIEEVLKLDPKHVDGLVNLGDYKKHLGDNEGAMESYEVARGVRPQDAMIYMKMASLLENLGRNAEASVMSQRAKLLRNIKLKTN